MSTTFFVKCIVMWHVTHFICCFIAPIFSEELYGSMFREVYIPLLEHLITYFYLCASIISVTSFNDSRKTEVRNDRVVTSVRKFSALQSCEKVALSYFDYFSTCLVDSTVLYLLTYLLMYLLTPRSRALMENQTGFQLVKKFPAFYGTRRFITAFTNARHLSLS